jgi:hypothetical protein
MKIDLNLKKMKEENEDADSKGINMDEYKSIDYEKKEEAFDEERLNKKNKEKSISNLDEENEDNFDIENVLDASEDNSNEKEKHFKLKKENKKKLFDIMYEEINPIKENIYESLQNTLKDNIFDYKEYLSSKIKSDAKDYNFDDFDVSKIINVNEYEKELNLTGKKQENLNENDKEVLETLTKYSNEIFEKRTPQILKKIDIYDENLFKYFEYFIQEQKIKSGRQAPSILFSQIIKDLKELDEKYLNPKDKIKQKHLIKLCELISFIQIKDADNLRLLFDIYQRPTIMEKI